MATVTVRAAGGTTVTISLNSAPIAAAAELALSEVNDLTASGVVDVQVVAGAGALPPVQNDLAAVVFAGAGFEGTTGERYRLIGANGTGRNAVLGGANERTMVVAGDGADLTYANLSLHAEAFYGKNDGAIVNYFGSVEATTADGTYTLASDVGSFTSMQLGDGGSVNVQDLGRGLGMVGVHALGSATISAFASTPNIPHQLAIVLENGEAQIGLVGTRAVIDHGAARVTILGDANASAHLYGGTGSVTVNGVAGVFFGGSAGGNLMVSSTVNGSTALLGGAVPGAPGDILIARGADQELVAASGNTTLAATSELGATGGSSFALGDGNATVFGFQQGGNRFIFSGSGDRTALVASRSGVAAGARANEFVPATGGGSYVIDGFVSGLDYVFDRFLLGHGDASISFFGLNDPANQSGSEVTILRTHGSSFYFFDATADGVPDFTFSDIRPL